MKFFALYIMERGLYIDGSNVITLRPNIGEEVKLQGSYNASMTASQTVGYYFIFYILLVAFGFLIGYYHIWNSMLPKHPLI